MFVTRREGKGRLGDAELRNVDRRAYAMGMAEVLRKYWRPVDVQALPYGRERYECIAGELLVTPAPRHAHQRVVAALFAELHRALQGTRGLEALFSPADLELEPGTLVQPDIFVERQQGVVRADRSWKEVQRLALVIEVLSPSSARFDRGAKRALYQRAQVEEYWIVDLEARAVERWVRGAIAPVNEREWLTWNAEGMASPLRLNLRDFFRLTLGPADG